MLEKEVIVDLINVDEFGRVSIRTSTRYLEDGVDDDVISHTSRVQGIVAAARDAATLAKWEDKKEKDKDKDK